MIGDISVEFVVSYAVLGAVSILWNKEKAKHLDERTRDTEKAVAEVNKVCDAKIEKVESDLKRSIDTGFSDLKQMIREHTESNKEDIRLIFERIHTVEREYRAEIQRVDRDISGVKHGNNTER